MHILYLHQYFKTPENAGGTRSYEMAKRFVRAGHRVTMITTATEPINNKKWEVTNIDGIEVHSLALPYSNHMSFTMRIKAFFKFALASARKAASFDADIIFATSTPLTIALPAVYAKRRLNIPMVFEVRDLWPELPIAIGALKKKHEIYLANKLENFAYRNADHVVVLSPGMKDGVASTGYPDKNITVVPNSSDLDLFDKPYTEGLAFRHKYDWLKDRPLVVYTGTLGHINGVGYLVDLAEKMFDLDPTVCFLIVGYGVEHDKVKEQARSAGVFDINLFMMSKVPKLEIPALLSAANVATSLFINLKPMWANSANKFFDALASGTPIMINYGGWQAELLEQSGAGLSVPSDNPELAAKQLLSFLKNVDGLKKAGNAAKSLAVNQFSRDDLAKQLLNVLEETAQGKITVTQ